MNSYRLTSMEEPGDERMAQIMREVAEDARESTRRAAERVAAGIEVATHEARTIVEEPPKQTSQCPKSFPDADKSIANCAALALYVDKLYVYDNSIEDAEALLLFRLSDGELAKRYVDELPNWASAILPK